VARVLSTTRGMKWSWATFATPFEVQHVALGVAEGLTVERLGVGTDGGGPGGEVVGVVHEGGLDAEFGQGVVKEVVGTAVERGRRDDVATVLGQVEQRDRLGRLEPDESARAATPPSKDAMRSSKAAWVGFMMRV
jgi:hypothetical protein